MPSSALVVWPTVIAHLEQLRPTSVLDVGCGHGKAAVLLREYLPTVSQVGGVEAWVPYIEQFGLTALYDDIYPLDILTMSRDLINSYDVVLMGDVLEHLTTGDGLALLMEVTRPVVISTPQHFFHNPEHLPWTETHRSHWTWQDFHDTGRLDRYDLVHGGQVVTLRGLPSP